MKKLMMTAMAVALAGVAGAQSLDVQEGTYRTQGCYAVKGGLQCDLTYTSKQNKSFYIWPENFEAVAPDGMAVKGRYVGSGGPDVAGFTSRVMTFYAGTASKFAVFFPMERVPSSLAVLGISGEGIKNVAVRSSFAVAASPPAAPTTAPAPVNTNNYNAVLTNCKAGSNGVLTCTATLTPRR